MGGDIQKSETLVKRRRHTLPQEIVQVSCDYLYLYPTVTHCDWMQYIIQLTQHHPNLCLSEIQEQIWLEFSVIAMHSNIAAILNHESHHLCTAFQSLE
jgi:hypothetical protein